MSYDLVKPYELSQAALETELLALALGKRYGRGGYNAA